jgi:hypothetical protein
MIQYINKFSTPCTNFRVLGVGSAARSRSPVPNIRADFVCAKRYDSYGMGDENNCPVIFLAMNKNRAA